MPFVLSLFSCSLYRHFFFFVCFCSLLCVHHLLFGQSYIVLSCLVLLLSYLICCTFSLFVTFFFVLCIGFCFPSLSNTTAILSNLCLSSVLCLLNLNKTEGVVRHNDLVSGVIFFFALMQHNLSYLQHHLCHKRFLFFSKKTLRRGPLSPL